LRAEGIAPEEITTVVLTHGHPDQQSKTRASGNVGPASASRSSAGRVLGCIARKRSDYVQILVVIFLLINGPGK
jgi:hypothetical protein